MDASVNCECLTEKEGSEEQSKKSNSDTEASKKSNKDSAADGVRRKTAASRNLGKSQTANSPPSASRKKTRQHDSQRDDDKAADADSRLRAAEEALRSLRASYQQRQWRHFRYVLPEAAAGLTHESDLAAAAIVSLRGEARSLRHQLQAMKDRADLADVTVLKQEVRRLKEDRTKLDERLKRATERVGVLQEQLEEADAQLDRAAQQLDELQHDYGVARRALESVVCDVSEQEYAANVVDGGQRTAEIILQLQMQVAQLENQLQEEKTARAALEAKAAEKKTTQSTLLSDTPKKESEKLSGKSGKKRKGGDTAEEPTAEELTERLQAVSAQLQEARTQLDEAEVLRRQQAGDYAVLREDVRHLHSKMTEAAQMAKRERAFSDALKEALDELQIQWRKQFDEDNEQIRLAETRAAEAQQSLAAAEVALDDCRGHAERQAEAMRNWQNRAQDMRGLLLQAQPHPPSEMIKLLGLKLSEKEKELQDVLTELHKEQQISAALEAQLCELEEYSEIADGAVSSYRIASTLLKSTTNVKSGSQVPAYIKSICIGNEIQELKEQLEKMRNEKLCILQQCADELATSRYLYEEAFNQLVPKD